MATSTGQEKPMVTTNRSNNSPPSSVVPDAVTGTATATIANVHGSSENDPMHSVDDPTATSGDSINKERS
jgi:hypothetical protein